MTKTLFYILIVIHINATMTYGANQEFIDLNIDNIRIKVPSYLKFTFDNRATNDFNLALSAPFGNKTSLIKATNYHSDKYIFTSLIVLQLSSTVAVKNFSHQQNKIIKNSWFLLSTEPKFFGSNGSLFHLKQWYRHQWFHKVTAVFNVKQGSIVVTAIYPKELEYLLRRDLRRVVEHSTYVY